jgi:hypothetical protein
MDPQEREFLQAAATNINDHTTELMERMAEWNLGVRDRTEAWLWFLLFVVVGMTFAARAGLSSYIVVGGLVAAAAAFEWILRKKAQNEWSRHDSARRHFQALLESRKALQSMTPEQRDAVKPEVRQFLLEMFLPSGLERGVTWEDMEDGVMHLSLRRLKMESMGLSKRRDEFPNDKSAEYAWDRYGEIDPEREWIVRLRERGGYVTPSERLRDAMERQNQFFNLEEIRNDFAHVAANNADLYQKIAPLFESWQTAYGQRIPAHELDKLQDRIKQEVSALKEKRQEIIDKAAKDGAVIQIASLRKNLEQARLEYKGADREEFAAHVELLLGSLEAEYGSAIPVDKAAKLLEELEPEK